MRIKLFVLYIFFVICFYVPSIAYAYLDPGTGNALIYVALSLLGAVFYFVKGFFYKVIKRKEEKMKQRRIVKTSIIIIP